MLSSWAMLKDMSNVEKYRTKTINMLKTFYLILNSLAPGKFEWNFRHVIFKQILVIDDWGISCEIALTWKPQDLTDDKSTLVEVMAWCRQATSQYLSQCWPSSLSPYGITRPQWVNSLTHARCGSKFRRIISKHLLHGNFMTICSGMALRWMLQNTFNDKSILVQVMAWCCQATSHYLS